MQRQRAEGAITLIRYIIKFGSAPGDLSELPSLFHDRDQVTQAAPIAKRLLNLAKELANNMCTAGAYDLWRSVCLNGAIMISNRETPPAFLSKSKLKY
eukprot:2331657-Pyramimonas_sp.AAC.1